MRMAVPMNNMMMMWDTLLRLMNMRASGEVLVRTSVFILHLLLLHVTLMPHSFAVAFHHLALPTIPSSILGMPIDCISLRRSCTHTRGRTGAWGYRRPVLTRSVHAIDRVSIDRCTMFVWGRRSSRRTGIPMSRICTAAWWWRRTRALHRSRPGVMYATHRRRRCMCMHRVLLRVVRRTTWTWVHRRGNRAISMMIRIHGYKWRAGRRDGRGASLVKRMRGRSHTWRCIVVYIMLRRAGLHAHSYMNFGHARVIRVSPRCCELLNVVLDLWSRQRAESWVRRRFVEALFPLALEV